MDKIGNNVIQKPLVVRNNYCGGLTALHFVYSRCHNAQRIHIQAAVCLIQNCKLWGKHSHLENLVTLLLSTGEAHIHPSGSKGRVHLHKSHLLLHHLKVLGCLKRLQSLGLSVLIYGCLHKVCYGYSRYLYRVLET